MQIDKKITIVGAVMIIFGLWMGPAVVPGIFLGAVSTVAMAMTYYSLPDSLKKIIIFFRIPIDLGLAFVVPFWFGNLTATAVVGSAVNSILFSILLEYEHSISTHTPSINKTKII